MRLWVVRAISFGMAWTIVLLALAILGELLDIRFVVPIGTLWICVGILARVARTPGKVAAALPVQVNGGAALKFLLTCVVWPLLVVRRRP